MPSRKMAIQPRGRRKRDIRRKPKSRRSLMKCCMCCHVARNHFQLRSHLLRYHGSKNRKSSKLGKRSKLSRNKKKRTSQRWNAGVSRGAGKSVKSSNKSIKTSPGKQGIVVLKDDNLKRSRKTTSIPLVNELAQKSVSSRSRKVSTRSQKIVDKVVTSSGRTLRSSRHSGNGGKSEVSAENSKSKAKILKSKRGPKKKRKGKRVLQPWPCKLCDYVGRDSYNLRRHMLCKHEPKPPKPEKIYQCEQCEYKNRHRFLVKRHSAVHARALQKGSSSGFSCDKCDYISASVCNLKRHQFCRHEKVKEAKLQCSLCDHREPDRPALFSHFREAHGVIIESERLDFDDYQSFMDFKADMEKATFARFVRQQTRMGQKKHVIFKCHRDGIFKSKSQGERKRALKTTGSNKINSACPASMKLTIDPSGKVSVVFTKTHVGHSNEVCRLTLTKQEKILIAEMLESKRTFQEILCEIRNGMESERLERIHLLSRKDLQNIERWYKNRDVEEPPAVSMNIDIEHWVAKIVETKVVQLYKKPATVLPKPFKCLDYDDFILILANDLQLAMLKQYGNDCICIDNAYENSQLKLTTLMVLDDDHQGFPCAFMLSSKIDKTIMKVFLDVVRKSSGCPMTPSVLISDIPDYRRTEWSAVMDLPESTEVLYSSWSVEEDLKRNLLKVKNDEERQGAYEVVKKVIFEETPSAVSPMIEKTVEFLYENPSTELFGKYFKSKFADTSRKWALCLRNILQADASKSLESTHEILKFVYSVGQKSKKLEDCISVFMTCTRDQLQDRIFLQERICSLDSSADLGDDLAEIVNSISKRHENAEDMRNQPADSGVYEIMEHNLNCRCGLRCFKCDVCIHSYR